MSKYDVLTEAGRLYSRNTPELIAAYKSLRARREAIPGFSQLSIPTVMGMSMPLAISALSFERVLNGSTYLQGGYIAVGLASAALGMAGAAVLGVVVTNDIRKGWTDANYRSDNLHRDKAVVQEAERIAAGKPVRPLISSIRHATP